MTKNHNNSKNTLSPLKAAIEHMLVGKAIVIIDEKNNKQAIYPLEFLNEASAKKLNLTTSPTLLALAKRAGLLPALAIMPASAITSDLPQFHEKELQLALTENKVAVFETARAKLPLEDAENSTIITFREENNDAVHLALIIGNAKKNNAPLVRVHSSCVTGDLLGSLRCDCGDQLKMALKAIKKSGYGVLLYMNQEGRGIGITNKIRAYSLQEKGLDTFEANHALGFESDERDFTAAAKILQALDIKKIDILSNNPHKIAELNKHGIIINNMITLAAPVGSHNHAYLSAKAKKAGHNISDI